jgi:hypothetical protein
MMPKRACLSDLGGGDTVEMENPLYSGRKFYI